MKRAYRAILRGNHLDWVGEIPSCEDGHPVHVEVTVIEEPALSTIALPGQKMAEILEKLARIGSFSDITDPVIWQRELREDRVLPGRED